MKITKDNIGDIYHAKQKSEKAIENMGYELVEHLFCDSSGFGQDNEPALTTTQLEIKLQELLNTHGTLYAWITGVGQFQVYVSLYKKTGKAKAKKIGNNTYLIDGTKILLHDTVILEQSGDEIILNTGGWSTRTTHDRMNTYLPRGIYVSRINWESKLHINGEVVDLIDGMKIKGFLNI